MFKNYYKSRFEEILKSSLQASDGLTEDIIQAKLADCQLIIPKALADYYTVAGQHPINEKHNRLLSIEEIDWIGDKLVFMEENQSVVYWGIDRVDISTENPIVWQGVNGDSIEWYEEKYTLSQFIMAMWRWTITGEKEEVE